MAARRFGCPVVLTLEERAEAARKRAMVARAPSLAATEAGWAEAVEAMVGTERMVVREAAGKVKAARKLQAAAKALRVGQGASLEAEAREAEAEAWDAT